MSEIAISLKNVSKCYKRYAYPVDQLKEVLLPGKSKAEEFWALRDINLDIHKGQTVGVVGRNGSGKSTMLQIIASTLTPTTGELYVNGRISALLELGSGFNPEFTGRQNVFFNGKLLGLEQKEIEQKFDEIVAFADIGTFLEQPVKTYSSGMFIRLAFAVSTIVEPDILVVDEALSVGDEAFQRKCFGRIQSIQERGGTILFVSHSASSIVQICNFAILMDRGELLLSGSPKFVVSKYQKLIYAPADKLEPLRQEIRDLNFQAPNSSSETDFTKEVHKNGHHPNRKKDEAFYDPHLIPKSTTSYISHGVDIKNPCITTLDGKVVNVLLRRDEYIYTYCIKFTEAAYKVRFAMVIKLVSGLGLGGAVTHTQKDAIDYVEKGKEFRVEFKFRCLLQPGVYFLNAGVMGMVNDSEVFLNRYIDIAIFRVHSEEEMLPTCFVDFYIEPTVSTIESEQIADSVRYAENK